MMLDYDVEAACYDDTRGGVARADAAADAIAGLLAPTRVRTLLDVAGGTGLVASSLAGRGFDVVVCDRSAGMLALAASRCPGRTLRGDATRLPVGGGCVDAVVVVWLLHLLASSAEVAAVVSEAARVLRPGGTLVSTVDKDAGHPPDTDVERLLAPYVRSRGGGAAKDARAQVEDLARTAGLTLCAEGGFVGHGQGRVPAALADALGSSRLFQHVDAHRKSGLIRDLRALPEPDRARTPPTYRLLAWQKVGPPPSESRRR
jgi:ubiquinone/menaquinone biosynthesis C-methylase UbiE